MRVKSFATEGGCSIEGVTGLLNVTAILVETTFGERPWLVLRIVLAALEIVSQETLAAAIELQIVSGKSLAPQDRTFMLAPGNCARPRFLFPFRLICG